MITQTINLNLIPGGVLPRINVSQYDKGSRTLNFNIYNGSVLFDIPTGSTITIQGTKPDHTGFQYSCEYEGSVVTANLEQQMSIISGEVTCEITINKDLQLIGTGNFILNVEPAAVKDDTVISETELPLIEQAIEAAAEAEASAISAAESAEEAASWSAHPPYIGENGNWYVYDSETEEFVDTGDPSRGPQGIQGETGPKGDTGVTPDITMNASVDNTSGTPAVVVTETGTDEDPVFSLAFSGLKGPQGDTGATGETGPQGPTGPTGNGISNITKTGTSGLVDTYTITYTDGTTSTFTVTNGRDGTGSGDMSMSDYDPTGSVKNDGGIPGFIADQISGKQNVILSSALPIGGANRTTVEEALGALADETGGHTILNESGTELPQRSKLQFEGATVSDDETNDATVVETVNPVDYEEDIYGVNLLDVKATSDTRSGITYTVNSNKTITLNGTSTNGYGFVLGSLYASNLKNGETYRLSDGGAGDYDPSGYTSFTYINGVKPDGTKTNNICITPTITTFTADFNTYVAYEVGIYVRAGKTISNLVYYPMIYKSSLGTNLPFVGFNEQSIQNQITDQTNVLGAKNLCPNNATAQSKDGITYTINADKSITANGTNSKAQRTSIDVALKLSLNPGIYYLSGCTNADAPIYYGIKNASDNSAVTSGRDTGGGAIFTILSGQYVNIYVEVSASKTVSNVKYYPMLRLASDPDDTYVSYAMTNRELTEKKINLSDLKTVVSSSSDFAAFKTAIANL